MCGITGIWNFDHRPIDTQRFDAFTDSLTHRGPDGRGVWIDQKEGIALGHRRLAILDLSEQGRQPMSYADGRFRITYNGEIYNFIELRAELEQKGHVFRSQSDTEMILAAYQEWGPEMLLRFNGMWAFAIHDAREHVLFVARDRFGIKPFLYHLSSTRFAFASELKAFKHLEGLEPIMDKESGAVFLSNGFGIEGTDRTMLEGVRRLPGGHYGLIKNGRLSVVRWWNTLDHLVDVPASLDAQAERFRELFYDSIRLRMRSDVPIGTCLSGGFDSTAVVCALAEIGKGKQYDRQTSDWQKAFVATFPGAANDERAQAEEAVHFSGVTARFTPVTDQEGLSHIDKVLLDFDDVYIGLPTPAWLIYRELRKANVLVSLDGHGADELMGGYVSMQEKKSILDVIRSACTPILVYSPYFAFLRAIAKRVRPIAESSFLRPDFGRRTIFSAPPMKDKLPGNWDTINRMLYPMFHATVLPTILRNFDRLSMAHGIEVRMPFMDWRLVTYIFSLPGRSKIGEGYTKRVARVGMAGKMPDSIRLSKTKMGFNAPLPEWFSGPLLPWMNNILNRNTEHELIDMPRFLKFFDNHVDKKTWTWQNSTLAWQHLHYLWFETVFTAR